ncbi:MAG: PaaI family thioesterase [Lentihominibacter sp.]|nr:PaaI family thioesterase [Lentihominibacter sp.]
MMETDVRNGQKMLEEHVAKTLLENNIEQRDTLNGMMKSSEGRCSFEDKTLTFEFPVQPWQANRVGNLHGGMICTAFDLTIAALARFYAGENFAPTVSLDVKYIRPVKVGDTLTVTARATATGKRITQLTGEAYIKETGRLAATAASVYMNVDTVKEREQNKK